MIIERVVADELDPRRLERLYEIGGRRLPERRVGMPAAISGWVSAASVSAGGTNRTRRA